MTGFKLTWRIEKPTLVENNSEVGGNISEATPTNVNHDVSSKLSHTWFVKMVQLAGNLRTKENLTEKQILDKVISGKMKNISINSQATQQLLLGLISMAINDY